MKMKPLVVLAMTAVAVLMAFYIRAQGAAHGEGAAVSTTVDTPKPTFIELGSDRCVSCRAMIPVLEELRKKHACKLSVRFIDVWDRPQEGERYGVRVIPTQLLLAPDGRELTRHSGFWSADAIRQVFAAKGYPLTDCGP